MTKPPTKEEGGRAEQLHEGAAIPPRGPNLEHSKEESSVTPPAEYSNDLAQVQVNGVQNEEEVASEALKESSEESKDEEQSEEIDEELEDVQEEEEAPGPCSDLKGAERSPGKNITGVEERASASKICTGSFSRGMERFRSQSPSPHASKSET